MDFNPSMWSGPVANNHTLSTMTVAEVSDLLASAKDQDETRLMPSPRAPNHKIGAAFRKLNDSYERQDRWDTIKAKIINAIIFFVGVGYVLFLIRLAAHGVWSLL